MNLLNIMLNMDIHWPAGAKLAVQDEDGSLKWSFHDELPKWVCGSGVWHRGKGFSDPEYGRIELADNYETSIILKEEYQKAGGWLEWAGGDCPVDEDQKVEYRLLTAGQDLTVGGELRWSNDLHPADIVAYRLLPQEEQQNPEATITAENNEYNTKVTPKTLEDKLKAIQEIREAIANTKTELQTQEETLKTLLAEVNSQVQTYGFTLSTAQPLVITKWWELQKGDVIIARGKEWHPKNKDKEVIVDEVEDQDYTENLPIGANGDWGKDFDFVRRPTKE